ncbi:MAG TPA: hypothetical protein VD816_15590 [Ohtaekwangia sp.]|nr:hypothetical protein [Ohtaekwangia sp.]
MRTIRHIFLAGIVNIDAAAVHEIARFRLTAGSLILKRDKNGLRSLYIKN